MVQKYLIYKFFFLIVIATLVQGLKIHQNHLLSLQIQNFAKHFKHKLQCRISHDSTQNGHDAEIPQNVFSDLKDFVANDPIIMNTIHADKRLSKVSAEKVKSYFLGSQEFKNFTVNNLVSSASDPKCLDGIDEDRKDRLFRIILNQLDFSTIFMTDKPEEEFTQDQVNAIVLNLKTDKQLRPYLEKCFGMNKNRQS